MKTTARDKRRRRLGAIALLCALLASLAVAVAPAAAEESDTAPLRNLSEGGLSFRDITGPTAPEEYPLRFEGSSPEIAIRQDGEQKVIAEYIEGGYQSWVLEAPPAHDAVGATVPTTLKLTEEDIVTLAVHFRAGNPAAGGAPFVYPIAEGQGWEGGWFADVVESSAPPTSPIAPEPPAKCIVPALDGFSLRVAKARLLSHHCKLGKVRVARGATAAKGKVVKQSHAAGAELATGAPVAIKLDY